MTQDAQSALRRIMENHSRITRFCLICNYVTRYVARPLRTKIKLIVLPPPNQNHRTHHLALLQVPFQASRRDLDRIPPKGDLPQRERRLPRRRKSPPLYPSLIPSPLR
jgi:DNA polymerase III delta prime subunit